LPGGFRGRAGRKLDQVAALALGAGHHGGRR
jgi:hypothetical protein